MVDVELWMHTRCIRWGRRGGGVKVNEGETEAEKKNEKEVQKKKKEKH